MGKKKRCGDCERKEVEKEADHLMDSWLCIFFDDVFCPFSKVPKEKRSSSVCLGCSRYEKFHHEMDEEEVEFWRFEEAVRKDPDAYLRGELG